MLLFKYQTFDTVEKIRYLDAEVPDGWHYVTFHLIGVIMLSMAMITIKGVAPWVSLISSNSNTNGGLRAWRWIGCSQVKQISQAGGRVSHPS